MNMSTPMLVTFLVYIAAMIFIGFWAWRSTKNFSDYILGGRSLGSVVTALSAGASDMSGWLWRCFWPRCFTLCNLEAHDA